MKPYNIAPRMGSVRENLARINEKIVSACARSGRSVADIQIVAVTKGQGPDKVREAASQGLKFFAENRLQEAETKLPGLKSLGEWHFIGHLQTNKARKVCQVFDLIQSVDSLHLAEAISKWGSAEGKEVAVMAEINAGGEAQKQGLPLEAAEEAVRRMAAFPGLKLKGLMAMAPLCEEEGPVRRTFAGLRGLAQRLKDLGPLALSMGMSSDYPIAVEEGATHLRIGRALFL
jgi:pyridoxal phosphate enzyme (YggS family)